MRHPFGTSRESGPVGAFQVGPLRIIASDGSDWPEELGRPAWEHVSISRRDRCPTWEEMAQVKAWFWDAEDLVLELHPPRSRYVNQHPFCLHLWRPIGVEIPLPPAITVGLV